MRSDHKCLIFLLFLFFGIFVHSALADPKLTIDSPSETNPPDKTLAFKLHFEWPISEGSYEISPLEPRLENLTLLKQGQSQSFGSQTTQNTVSYEFQPLGTGPAVIRSFKIRIRHSTESEWKTLTVPEQQMTIKGGFSVSRFSTLVFFIAIFIAVIFSIMLLVKAHRSKIPANPPAPNLRQQLYKKAHETIAASFSISPRDKLSLWSSLLREVVIAYYGIALKNATESEIISILKGSNLPLGEVREVTQLFDQMRSLRFSREDFTPQELELMQQSLLQYVRGKIIIENS